MNDLQIFNSPIFGEFSVIQIDNKPHFPATKSAEILGYGNPRKAILDHCKGVTKRDSLSVGGAQETNYIPESDLYRLIIRSKLPTAEKFERWIFDEVLPSIRKHGAFMTTDKLEEVMNDPDAWIKMLNAIKTEREEKKKLQAEAVQNHPKVLFADAVSSSETSILVGELAKLLQQNGVDINQKRLFEVLRAKGYLIKEGRSDYNMPTQKSMDMGLFEIKETAITHSKGNVKISKTPKVTGKGQTYFIAKFLVGDESKPQENTKYWVYNPK